jgi:hypothetical protein
MVIFLLAMLPSTSSGSGVSGSRGICAEAELVEAEAAADF